jgi:hypothetical protein
MMAANGRLPASSLASIGGGHYLRTDAAAAFLAMNAESIRRGWGAIPVLDAYRTLGHPGDLAHNHWSQWMAWERYTHGGNLAAHPGTSNHGLGLAIDLGSQRARWIVDQIGAAYGWAKRWSDAPSEWWHIRWRPGVWKGHAPSAALPTVRYRMSGRSVSKLNHLLRVLGFKSVPRSRYFGLRTRSAVKRFQKAHKLKADGVVGQSTWRALIRAAH